MYVTAKAEHLSQRDWHYTALREVFSPPLYKGMATAVASGQWVRAEKEFYRQYERRLNGPDADTGLFPEAFQESIRSAMEQEFNCGFDEPFDAVAHRFDEGDFVGIHTDRNTLGESHRLVVFLNDGWTAGQGGIFLTLRSDRLEDVCDAWLPAANTGVAFRIGDDSFHAITPVVGKVPRYSVVFTFRAVSVCSEGAPPQWTSFPLVGDIQQAKSTASYMGIPEDTFGGHYTLERFNSVRDFVRRIGGRLANCPESMSYRDGRSINVDHKGIQSKGSDLARVEAITRLRRIPPIIVVRRASGAYVLVDGSHRLSYAADNGGRLHVAIYEEMQT